MAREVITRKDIVKIFASHNNYIMGFSADSKEDDYVAQNDIDEIVRAINSAYRVSKLNFIWKKKRICCFLNGKFPLFSFNSPFFAISF